MFHKLLTVLLGLSVLAPSFAFAASDSTMMTHGLDAPCSTLKKLSMSEKAKMITDIGHNMDMNALRPVFRCMFQGKVQRVAVITDNDLKMNPKDREFLYYIPETGQFFVTCKSMFTIAYVVDAQNIGSSRKEWKSYFQSHRSAFADTAQMAKDMMK